jgi:serine/threonine protein kinase
MSLLAPKAWKKTVYVHVPSEYPTLPEYSSEKYQKVAVSHEVQLEWSFKTTEPVRFHIEFQVASGRAEREYDMLHEADAVRYRTYEGTLTFPCAGDVVFCWGNHGRAMASVDYSVRRVAAADAVVGGAGYGQIDGGRRRAAAAAEAEAAAEGDVVLQAKGYSGYNAGRLGVFERQQEVVQGRPTYKKRGEKVFLFYTAGGHWMVGEDTSVNRGGWKARSAARTPSAITEPWEVYDGKGWVEVPAAKIAQRAMFRRRRRELEQQAAVAARREAAAKAKAKVEAEAAARSKLVAQLVGESFTPAEADGAIRAVGLDVGAARSHIAVERQKQGLRAMKACAEKISALQAEACRLAEQAWRDGNTPACSVFCADIVAQPALAGGLGKIHRTFQTQLAQHASMEQAAAAVCTAERHQADHQARRLLPMAAPATVAPEDVAAAKAAMMDALPAIFVEGPAAPRRVSSLGAYESIYSALSDGGQRLRELRERERAVDAASKSTSTTIEQLEAALQEASKAGLPAESPAFKHGYAVLATLMRRRAAGERIAALLVIIDKQRAVAAPALAPVSAADDAAAALEQALGKLREGIGSAAQAALVDERDAARRALIGAMKAMQDGAAAVAHGGLGAAHAVLQVALEDLRAELDDTVPQIEQATRALLRTAGAAPPVPPPRSFVEEDEDESMAPHAIAGSFDDAMAQQCAAAHGRTDTHAALLAQLAGAARTLEHSEAELPRLREHEASPPDVAALGSAAKALKRAKVGLQRARQDYDLEAGDGDPDAAELQALQEGIDAASKSRRTAEAKLNALSKVALSSVVHYAEVAAVVAKDIPTELLQLWQPHRQLSDFVTVEEIAGGRHRIHKVGTGGGRHSVLKEFPLRGELKYFLRELQRLHALRHPCVMEIEAIFVDGERKSFFVQMPFCPGGNLDDFVKARVSAGAMSGSDVRLLLHRALQGVEYLHALGIVHADLKPANILVDGAGMPRLTDFETSRAVGAAAGASSLTKAGGTRAFEAPELRDGSAKPTMASDMFAFGKTLEAAREAMAALPGDAGVAALSDLIGKLALVRDDARPTTAQALQHRYFTADAAAESARLLSAAELRTEETRSKREQVDARLQKVYGEQCELRRQAAKLAQRRAMTEVQQSQARAAALRNEQQARDVQADQRRLQVQRAAMNNEQRKVRERLAAEERQLQEKRRAVAQQHAQLKRQAEKLPSYWSMQHLKHGPRQVDVTDEMKAKIQRLLDATCNSATLGRGQDQRAHQRYTKLVVAKVKRIESPVVWRVYAAKREAMRAALFKSNTVRNLAVKTAAPWMHAELDAAVNEKYVWHGTKPDLLDIIESQGFDERVGALTGMFGAGVYFADMCSKSDQYCTPNRHQSFFLFLSRAMFGAVHNTQVPMQQTRRPPIMPSIPGRPHDSIVYVPGRPHYSEYIVYDKTQAYPEFLVEYKRV